MTVKPPRPTVPHLWRLHPMVKWKRCENHTKNKIPDIQYNVTAIDRCRKPVELPIVSVKFNNSCGSLVKNFMPINAELCDRHVFNGVIGGLRRA
uniref:Uncharacterized protein n=1 Tax=Oryza brachyantha TaxID=4533 RepID=J3N167_ORYBR